jgi:coenzyme PQQ precursor peptide PqqA
VAAFRKMDKWRRTPHITVVSGRCMNAARGIWKETKMAWKTPKIVEVPVGMEINMYACAARK